MIEVVVDSRRSLSREIFGEFSDPSRKKRHIFGAEGLVLPPRIRRIAIFYPRIQYFIDEL